MSAATPIDRLSRALEVAISAARDAGAADVEASYQGAETHFVRFASSRFTQVGRTIDDALRVRVIVEHDGAARLGSQLCASLEPDAAREAAQAAVAVARLAPPLDVPLTFAGPGPGDTADADAGEVALPEAVTAVHAPARLGAAFAPHRAAGVTFAGAMKSHRQTLAVRTAAGLDRRFSEATSDVQMIAIEPGGASGYGGSFGPADRAMDLAGLAASAADKARRSADPIDLEPGRYDLVLAPPAVAELVEWMSMVSFGATALIDGVSLLAGRAGAELCDPRVTLRAGPAATEVPFDAEGSPRREVLFLDHGRGGHVVTDRISALRLGDERGSTGHAPPVTDDGGEGPRVRHLWMEPGEATVEQLVGAVDRGLMVTRLHYVNGLLDPRKATTTGMTRDGTFMIEGGKLGRGVRNLRFTEHMLDALSRIGGIGAVCDDVPTWWSDGGVLTVPHLLIRGFRFTGRSR